MPQGIIIKGIGGFYYVKAEGRVLECKARGRFRNEKITPLVGDMVDIVEKSGGSMIQSILPRKTELIRPSVANVDQAVIVFACTKPEPNLNLLDRFLVLSAHNRLETVICLNKLDLTGSEAADRIAEPYRKAGYVCIYTSTVTGQGIEELRNALKNKITVFAGPSGVGKSSILNKLQPSLKLKTGDISEKLERGRHTTRHSELMEFDGGGYVVDTPGFSSLDIDFISKEEIEYCFPEFNDFRGLCRFTGCSHISEPGCAVKEAVKNNAISETRYASYARLYDEISKIRVTRFKNPKNQESHP